ncbi:uncharacterized protein BDW70DRAFT_164520 [Aspergillus foveolatus]|uniref:uncharacterized protein n=1 Tax=Aspergillus foveolatus TaxID=210207 RepID=UPI003CCE4B79
MQEWVQMGFRGFSEGTRMGNGPGNGFILWTQYPRGLGKEMRERFGIPMEVLDAPLAIDEFGYMGGVEGYIEPRDLTSTVVTRSFEEWLNTRDWKELALAGEKELEGVKV